jgi:hypothetical protein
MVFLSHLYLKDTMPPELQIRFLNAAVKATQVNPTELRQDRMAFSWAVSLLQRTLPVMQKLTPALYSTAAAQLASLAPGQPRESLVYDRIKNSSDPLEQTMLEADQTNDERLKTELLESAARLAKQQGKLRLAADLMTTKEEDRSGLPEGYSSQDEFLDGVVLAALKQKDPNTAKYVLAKMRLYVSRSEALRKVARYFTETKDTFSAIETLGEATKILAEASDGREKVLAYLKLTTDFSNLDYTRATETARVAVKAANNISRPQEDEEGKFNLSLFPALDSTIKTFQTLARKDRMGALGLADTFQTRDFKIAATIGAYSATAVP